VTAPGLTPITCSDDTVISGFARCNGISDCADGSDENGCTKTGFKCRTVDQFVDFTLRCDGRQDCPDGSDETPDCKLTASCKDGTKIAVGAVCNKTPDCVDGSDESVECAPFACPMQ